MRLGDDVADFRGLIGTLGIPGRVLDPADRNAHRCDWGGVITADGTEAEVALAPVPRRPGFVGRLARGARRAREALRATLPARAALEGYSTHLSLSMPGALNAEACRLFLGTFAPGLMLLADRATSPGLIARPRPGRMELAVEYVDGAHLRAAAAFATGGALAVAGALSARGTALPPNVRYRAVTTGDRFGWGVRRDAYGEDLLARGREAPLVMEDGREVAAQEHLERAWASARAALGRSAHPGDLAEADAAVAGRLALPSERHAPATDTAARGAAVRWSAYGDALRRRERPGFAVEATVATWDTTVYAIAAPARVAFASVPRASLTRFLRSLDAGALDGVIASYLAAPAAGRTLTTYDDAIRPGLYDALGPASGLVARELPTGVRAEDPARAGKFLPPPRTGVPPWIWVAIGITVAIVIGVIVAGGRTATPPPPLPTTTSAATATPGTAAEGPRITRFTAVLTPPNTVYTIEVQNPAGGPLQYSWSANVSCPGWTPSTTASAVWVHPHPPCPEQPIHPGSITVRVTDARGQSASYTYTGGSAPADVRP